MGMKSKIVINNRKMFCTNPECSHTTFAETFIFINPKAKKSKRLLDKIIDVSLNVTSLNASDILKNGIADVGKSIICNLLKKDTPQPDKKDITKVCIDDFAFKKRYMYGTIMIDIDTHRVIDLFPSREIKDVAEWLASFPNLEIVSRDGSVSYNSAVHGKYNTTRNSKIKPYAEKIKQMLKDKYTFLQIEEAIRKDGYDGAASTIRMFTTRERKLLKEAEGDSLLMA